MNIPNNDVTSTIQLALAPVFLLMAVVTLFNAISGRLARVIDRMRFLHTELFAPGNLPEALENHYRMEYPQTKRRGRLCAIAIFFDVLSGLLISLTVLELFLFQTGAPRHLQGIYVVSTFVGGLICFVISLVIVLSEVVYAYLSASWDPPIHPRKDS
jgi:hypothetical protein